MSNGLETHLQETGPRRSQYVREQVQNAGSRPSIDIRATEKRDPRQRYASQQISPAHIRFGSLTDIEARLLNVRFGS